MRVLLATPPQPRSVILPDHLKRFGGLLEVVGGNRPVLGLQPPYGLLYLSTALKRRGHEVRVVDGLVKAEDEVLGIIRDWRPDVLGLSSVTLNWSTAKVFARKVKEMFPGLLLACGGAHVNAIMGSALDDCLDFDMAFFGDAEESFCEVIDCLESRQAMVPRTGVAYRSGTQVIASKERSVIWDIDSIGLPDRGQLDMGMYRPSPQSYRQLPFAAVIGSRGCPGRCTFCHSDSRTRIRSADSVMAEIGDLVSRHGVRDILFYDENFLVDRDRALSIAAAIRRLGVRLTWAANGRVDRVDAELLKALREAGCWRLLLGIESGSQRILDRVNKGVTISQVEAAVGMIRRSGIQTYGMFIFGFPTETYEEGLQTIRLMKSLGLDFVNVSALTPFPGTDIYSEVCNEPGFLGFEHMNMYDISYVPSSMTKDQLAYLLRTSMRDFYFRLPYMLGQLRHIRSFSDAVRYARGASVMLLR